jgi:hypothetical protein
MRVINRYCKPSETGIGNLRPAIVALALIAFWMSSVGQLNGQYHEMSGTVQRVDDETITILPAGESKPVVFEWNKDTKFLRNRAFTTVDALRPGVQVTTRCRHSIFGPKSLLYRVAWQGRSDTKGR